MTRATAAAVLARADSSTVPQVTRRLDHEMAGNRKTHIQGQMKIMSKLTRVGFVKETLPACWVEVGMKAIASSTHQ